jgi:hypothetical protein
MARPAKRVRVTLEAIRCTNVGTDPGSTLEIYGFLDAEGVVIDPHGDPQPGFKQILWSLGPDEAADIARDTEIPVNQSATFPVFDRDFLWLGGRVRDKDTFGPDDTLGDGHRKMNFQEIQNQIVSVGFNPNDRSGQEVVARYRIEVLGIEPHPELN